MPKWKLLLGAGLVLAALLGVGAAALALAPAMEKQWTYGTVASSGPPPRVHYCGRDYVPVNAVVEPRSSVDEYLSKNGRTGFQRIGTTPSGMPVLAIVIPEKAREAMHTKVCTMVIWVETGPDSYIGYPLAGGP